MMKESLNLKRINPKSFLNFQNFEESELISILLNTIIYSQDFKKLPLWVLDQLLYMIQKESISESPFKYYFG